ncbi:MAG: thymidine kinase [Bdellovibrionaceae bacterium]|nr:thymidine kinase [Bdellovibrio sp.]
MSGWIEVIAGSMYSGKTEELIRRIRRAQFAKMKVQVFKPAIDQRYHETHVTSHDQTQVHAVPLLSILDIWDYLEEGTQVVGFDEGQFFSMDLVKVSRDLAARGIRVIVAGLDMDWKAQPFEPIPTLMAIAEDVTKQRAICMSCGQLATYTQKTSGSENAQVEVGAQDFYEARCRLHFTPTVEQQIMHTDNKLDFSLPRT